MDSSKFVVLSTLLVMIMIAISYEPFPWMGVNASDDYNQTLENRELAHKDGYKLYGYPYSANTRRVLAVLHEKNISFERIIVDLRSGEQKKTHFLSINPFGLVPVFLDGHLTLTESRAMTEYIETVHKSKGPHLLNHKNHKKMGTERMWIYIESFEFDPPAATLTIEQAINPLMGLKTNHTVVKQTEPILEKVLNIYEERLKKSRFLAGESFTLADLHHLPNIDYLMGTSTKRLFLNRPSVSRWVAEIRARPAWKKACDVKAWPTHKKKN